MIKKSITIILALFLLASSYVLFTIWELNPNIHGQDYHAVLQSRVEIKRSSEGVASIHAETEQDAYYVQGFVHAQDRLFQMVFTKHFISGRMSELIGEKGMALDRYMRTFGLGRAAKASYEVLDSRTQQAMVSYAKGVNAYIADNTCLELKLLGVTPEDWDPSDAVLIQKAIAFDLSKHWPQIIRNTIAASKVGMDQYTQFIPNQMLSEPSVHDDDLLIHKLPYSPQPNVYPDGPEVPENFISEIKDFAQLSHAILSRLAKSEEMTEGSNIWAISKERSTKGHVLLANDPHLSYQVPTTFYPISIKAGKLNLQGTSVPGAPGIIIGRNADVAWGFTNSRLAQCDLFYAPEIEGKIQRDEVISVKGGEDITITYFDTPYGTIVSGNDADLDIALKWVGQSYDDHTLDALYLLSVAKSFEEASQAIKYFDTPAQNIVIVDQENYGFFTLGRIPIRQHSGRIAVPAEPEYLWNSYIPKNKLPYAKNPKRGYVMNANNHVVSDHYGYNLTRLGYDEFRGVKVNQVLGGSNMISPSGSKRLQLNNEDQLWVQLKPYLLGFEPKSERAITLLESLRNWSGAAELDSHEQTLFAAWHAQISKKIFANVNQSMPYWARVSYDDLFIKEVLEKELPYLQPYTSVAEFLEQTLLDADTLLTSTYGASPESQVWENAHQASFVHPIFKGLPILGYLSGYSVKAPGSKDSVNRSLWRTGMAEFNATEGASLRVLVDMSTPHLRMMITMGASGYVFSSYYANLNSLWAKGKYMLLPSNDISGHEATLVLLPDSII
ncbi:penicillin acylase family protein [Gammaproteobacteria bacterium]|nr:penicillin acylase family protein [Gammaproteobacteria bacterium]